MSYADMAAKGPKQTDEEKYVKISYVHATTA
jgi:hypothetical protein